jgi:hypothetical protein
MNKDAQPPQRDQETALLVNDGLHKKTWRRGLYFGAVGGLVMAALNLNSGFNNGLLRDYFKVLDVPLELMARQLQNQFGFLTSSTGFNLFFDVVVVASYWIVIGMSVASLYCLARTGVIRDFVRNKTCRRALRFGGIAGICIGGLNLLALTNRSGNLAQCFLLLDRPVELITDALFERFRPAAPSPQGGEIICVLAAIVVYWVTVAELVTSFFCIFWVAGKRREMGPSIY